MMNFINFVKNYWGVVTVLFTAFWSATYIMFMGLWTIYGDNIIERTKEELGIIAIEERIGTDDIIRQLPGQTFVIEPVVFCNYPDIFSNDCGVVEMVFTFARTPRGAAECEFMKATPIFVSSDGTTHAGEWLGQGAQYDTNTVRAVVRVKRLTPIPVGRTTLSLQLEYECEGKAEFVLTDPAVFNISPKGELDE